MSEKKQVLALGAGQNDVLLERVFNDINITSGNLESIRIGPNTEEQTPFDIVYFNAGGFGDVEQVRTVFRRISKYHPSATVYVRSRHSKEELALEDDYIHFGSIYTDRQHEISADPFNDALKHAGCTPA